MKRTPLFSFEVNIDNFNVYDSLDKPCWGITTVNWPWLKWESKRVEITTAQLIELLYD